MARRRFMWSLALPLAAVGWLAGHSLAYTLVVPHDAHREELLAETGHAYLAGTQEYLERLIELNAFPFGAALEPTFIVGMALQLPFALAAVTLARAALGLGYLVGRAFAVRRSPRPPAHPTSWRLPAWLGPMPVRPLAAGHGERAPPGPRTT
jgi:hypothetical protein